MAYRFGNVVYWTLSAGAALIAIYAAQYVAADPTPAMAGMAIAGAVWLAGRAIRYVLAGT